MTPDQLAELQAAVMPARVAPPTPTPPDLPPIGEVIGAVLARVTDPPRFSKPRGIVTAAGGKVLLTNAYVLFRLLRHLGCNLPIECWQLPHERDEVWQGLVEPLGVRIVDARARGFVGSPFVKPGTVFFKGRKELSYRRDQLDGYALKPFALQWCDFREALWLDGDNCPERNPVECFDWPEYRAAGMVLWPDYDPPYNKGFARPVNSTFGLPDLEPHQGGYLNGIETGQKLADKTKLHVWSALHLDTWFSEHAEVFYGSSWGEKDTTSSAARLVGFEPAITTHPAIVFDSVCRQCDFQGMPMFWHRFGQGKWRYEPGPQFEPEGFSHQKICLDALAYLRERWPTPQSA